jgi:ribonuclease HII
MLEPEVREKLAIRIRARALAWSVAWADREEVDSLNILEATLLAMRRALLGLQIAPDEVRIDGDRCPSLEGLAFACPAVPIIRGDALVPAISAASILAKTYRDAWMRSYHEIWPDYGFASHKGYATPEHLAALTCHGACPLHRRSFMPVKVMTGFGGEAAPDGPEAMPADDAQTATIALVQLPFLA